MTQIDIDTYIREVVARHTPVVTHNAWNIVNELQPYIHAWANGHQYELKLSGSIAKGTAITGASDMDLFISLNPSVSTCNTLEDVYTTLRNRFTLAGYSPREQNVSLGIVHSGLSIDVVPGVKQHLLGSDHSVWKRKARTWTKTNIDEHVSYVSRSGRVFDIKVIKIWRKLHNLDFPSFYLELSVIEALKGKWSLNSSPSQNFVVIMNYLANNFVEKTLYDPANQANEVSEELTVAEKEKLKGAAVVTLNAAWNEALF